MNKTILLVDDDPIQLKLTRAILADAGFDVRTARGGGEALEAARASRPDAIVSDVLMRDCDGFRLCQQLRAEASLATVPVVLVSAHFQSERDKDLATAVGANGFAERSPDFARELAEVRRALGSVGLAPAKKIADTGRLYAEAVSDQLAQLLDKARAADMRYRALFESASDGIAVLDESGVILEVNRRTEEMSGRAREALVGKHMRWLAEPGFEDENDRAFAASLSGAQSPLLTLQRANGERFLVQISTSGLEIDGKRLVLVIGRDVTREIEAVKRLADSEEKYRRLVENLIDVAWSSRLSDGQLLVMSPNVERLTGFTVHEVMAAGAEFWSGRVHPEDQERMNGARRGLRLGQPLDEEFRWQHKDGSWRWLRTRADVAHYDGIGVVEGLISDISQRKRLEDEFRQAQKMEALGRLTGGVAHDFNNLLCVILASTDLVMRTLNRDDPRREDLAAVREAGERASALTRQLLAFSRKQVLQLKRLDLAAVMRGVEKLLGRVIGEDIRLEMRFEDELQPVTADSSQLEQVLMNLAVNARDAMPDGGTLKLDARNVTVKAGELDELAAGRYVRLSVSDTGCGMDEATRLRVFEPFFTTKPAGKGTGLGLSTCYGIVKQSGGHIAVSSGLGRGTTFTLHLPSADGETVPAGEKPVETVKGGSETVLLAEDDPALRTTISRMLSRLGYQVLAASDGDDAGRLFDENRAAVKLLVSDVVLPDCTGFETLARLRKARFGGKVLFISGYADRPGLDAELQRVEASFLQKPFPPEELTRTVRELLDTVASTAARSP